MLSLASAILVAATAWPNFTAETRATISPTITDMAGMVLERVKQFAAFSEHDESPGDSSLQHIVVKVCWFLPAGLAIRRLF